MPKECEWLHNIESVQHKWKLWQLTASGKRACWGKGNFRGLEMPYWLFWLHRYSRHESNSVTSPDKNLCSYYMQIVPRWESTLILNVCFLRKR